MEFARVALAVAGKDLRSELRSRELLPALAQFSLLALLVANFAFDLGTGPAAAITPGVLYLAVVFAGLLAFGRSFAGEREQGSLEALLLTPAPRAAIFAGKALASAALLLACEVVLVPAMALFFQTPVLSLPLIAALLLSTAGMAALGCLFAALAAQTRARELLLPALALPLWLPLIVFGGRAVQVAMGAAGGAGDALGRLLAIDVLFIVVASLAAHFVLDD